MLASEEKERLEKIAEHFSMLDGFNGYMTKYRVDAILKNCPRGTMIDFASADAIMAEALYPFYDRIVCVEGSQILIDKAKNRLSNVKNIYFVCSLIEEFTTDEKFDVVLLSFILEHVEDPVSILKKVKTFIKPNGCLFVMVPNAESLHRRVGKAMGLIPKLNSLNESDIRQGHRRVYNLNELVAEGEMAGLKIQTKGSFFLKPMSNPQMEKIDKSISDALYEVSLDVDEKINLGSMIFFKAIN